MTERITQFADGLFNAIEGYVARSLAPLFKRLVSLEGREPERGKDGVDGKSVEPAEVERLVRDAVAALPKALDGIDGEPGPKGLDGRDGIDGRDAMQIDVLDDVDVERSYPRGTWARWNGGIIRSFRATDPLTGEVQMEKSGWTIIVDGIAGIFGEHSDDPRRFEIRVMTTSGKSLNLPFSMPTPIYRNVWTEREYERGDLVTYDGSVWHCERPTKAKPGTQTSAPDWKLCTKKGRDGKDGEKGVKGDRGEDGRPGKDLTQLGWDGSKT